MKEFLVSNVNYAASKTSATANTATSPDLLAAGAVGFYYMDNTTGKLTLLTAAVTGNISNTRIVFAQGTAAGNYVTRAIVSKDAVSAYRAEYTTPVREIGFLGYNGTSGTLNLNLATLVDYTDVGISTTSRFGISLPEEDKTTSSATLLASDVAYTAAGKVSIAVNADKKVSTYVISNPAVGVVTATAASGATFVNGSPTVSGITAGITLNNYLSISVDPQTGLIVAIATTNSVYNAYRAIAVGASTITLDRPWEGASQNVSAAAFNAATTANATIPAATTVGLALVSAFNQYQTFDFQGIGAFVNATRTIPGTPPAIGMFPGSGPADQVKAIEKAYFINSGFWNVNESYLLQPTSLVSASGQYDLYFFRFEYSFGSCAAIEARLTEEYDITLAVADGTTAGNATIDTIISSLFSVTGTPVTTNVVTILGDLTPSS